MQGLLAERPAATHGVGRQSYDLFLCFFGSLVQHGPSFYGAQKGITTPVGCFGENFQLPTRRSPEPAKLHLFDIANVRQRRGVDGTAGEAVLKHPLPESSQGCGFKA